MGIISEEFLVKDIKDRIDNSYHNEEYIRGYMVACYTLGAIKKDTLNELKKYLKKEEEEVKNENDIR